MNLPEATTKYEEKEERVYVETIYSLSPDFSGAIKQMIIDGARLCNQNPELSVEVVIINNTAIVKYVQEYS